MAEVLFVDQNYIKVYSQVTDQVDPNLLFPCTKIAQDKHAEMYLGTNLLNKLKADAEGAGSSGNYLILLTNYLKPMLLWWTLVELYPHLIVKIDNGSLSIRNGEDFTTATSDQYKRLLDDARNNAQMYTNKMIRYLCANSSLFPEYTNNTWPNISPKHSVYAQSMMRVSEGNTSMSRGTDQWYVKNQHIIR
jgi:hypothetical protein